MYTVYAWAYSTCHIMVDSTVWFGRRRPMTWMRPGSKSLFCRKISPKSHFIHLQTRWSGWRSARVVWNAPLTRTMWVWDLQLVFRTVHNLREKWLSELKCRRMIVFLPQRSSSEVIPDIRNGMKIFSPVSGWMMACVQRAWHRPRAVRGPEGFSVWRCG